MTDHDLPSPALRSEDAARPAPEPDARTLATARGPAKMPQRRRNRSTHAGSGRPVTSKTAAAAAQLAGGVRYRHSRDLSGNLTPEQRTSVDDSVALVARASNLGRDETARTAARLDSVLADLHDLGHRGVCLHNLSSKHIQALNDRWSQEIAANRATGQSSRNGAVGFTRRIQVIRKLQTLLGRSSVLNNVRWTCYVEQPAPAKVDSDKYTLIEDRIRDLSEEDFDELKRRLAGVRGRRLHLALLAVIRHLDLSLREAFRTRPDLDFVIGVGAVRILPPSMLSSEIRTIKGDKAVDAARLAQTTTRDLQLKTLCWPRTGEDGCKTDAAARNRFFSCVTRYREIIVSARAA